MFCYGCHTQIMNHEVCVEVFMTEDVDGVELTTTYHKECAEVEEILNEALIYGDDWIYIDTMEQDDYDWVSIEYPIVAERVAHKFK